MKLTVCNGSPRGRKGNTEIMLDHFLAGFESIPGNTSERFHLNRAEDQPAAAEAFGRAEAVLIAMPLYTDAMPGLVMAFFELLKQFQGRPDNPRLGFLVQSGFPEAAHSRHLERYLRGLAERLGCPYMGTLVRGGGEGLRVAPPKRFRKLFALLEEMGLDFGHNGEFDPALLKKLARPERFPAFVTFILKPVMRLGVFNGYWNRMLKKNHAWEKRFDKPYLDQSK